MNYDVKAKCSCCGEDVIDGLDRKSVTVITTVKQKGRKNVSAEIICAA